MADRYGWICDRCGEYFTGPYRESMEREREHRASCFEEPAAKAPAPQLSVPWPEKRYVGCSLGMDKCAAGHYWESPKYRGEVCCQSIRPCGFLKEATLE
jgi:hypothetical protein